ncbi:calponin homology domain-containing protein [Chytriomyces cf. hyalinus JEL632]|nr:calponin homology domain-containing protein [Chytriomyces cf. hyalinus JEL632]
MQVVGGLDRDLAAKMASKYDPVREREAQEYLESVLEMQFPSDASFQEALKDGTILCQAINKLSPSTTVKFNQSKMPFKQMENINAFLVAAEKMGVNKHELFQTVDLYEAKNMVQVIDSIYALSRCAESKGYQGSRIGPKLAERKEYHFSAETLAEGKATVPILTGFKSAATQSGAPAFGSKREIGGVDLGRMAQ